MDGHAATALQRHEPRRHTSLLNPHAWQYYGRCQLYAVWNLDMRQPVRRSAPSDPCSAPPTRHGRTQFICPWNLAPKIRRRGRRSHSSRLPRAHTDGRARTAAAAAPAWRVARARGPAATHVCPRPRLAPPSPSPAAAPPAPVRRRLRHSMQGTGAKFMHREKVTSCVQRSAPRPGPASCRVQFVLYPCLVSWCMPSAWPGRLGLRR